jgi:radical SAM superfamily enzyme YgiQ (UPF0313 family)
MRVLFVFPGRREFTEPEPLNLEVLAGTIPDCDIEIADMRFDKRSLRDIISTFAPHIVATTATTICVYQAQDILKSAKEIDERIFTVVGGSHPSSWPSDFNLPYVDAIVIGMGEDSFREIVRAVSMKKDIYDVDGIAIPGEAELTYTKPREINRNLSSFAFPRRDLTEKHHHQYRYSISKNPMAMISTSRGCPNRCSFCAIWKLMKKRYITRTPESVVEELATIKQKVVRFADGNTFGDIKRIHSLCDRIIESGFKKRLMMDISTNIVVKNADLIEKMRRTGLFAVVLGIESVVDETLASIGKNCTLDDHDEAINILHKNGIAIAGNFIVQPDFEPSDFDRVEEYIIKKNIELPVINILTPLPGTTFFEESKDEILTYNYDYFDFRHLVLPTKTERKTWWKKYQKLSQRSMYRAFEKFSTLIPIVYKPAIAALLWKSRKDYLLKKPGRPGTYLHDIVTNRMGSAAPMPAIFHRNERASFKP